MSNKHNYLVKDVMLGLSKFPIVDEKNILKEALDKMDFFKLGIACIVNGNMNLMGVITDGDIRRKLLSVQKPLSAFFIDDAFNYSVKNPISIQETDTLFNAIEIMGKEKIWDLPVLNKEDKIVGLLHLHQAINLILKDI